MYLFSTRPKSIYKVYDLDNNKLLYSWDIFHEAKFPYRAIPTQQAADATILPLPCDHITDHLPSDVPADQHSPSSLSPSSFSITEPPNLHPQETGFKQQPEITNRQQTPPTETENLKRSERVRRPSFGLRDFTCLQVSAIIPNHDSLLVAKTHKRTKYPISYYISYSNLSPDHRSLTVYIFQTVESAIFAQAVC